MKEIRIDTLGYFVDRTFTNMVKFLNMELTDRGLDIQHPQFTILMILSKQDGLPQNIITDIVDRDKASVSRNIKYLEGKGYLRRDMEDGKKKLLFLTEKGKSIIPIIHEMASNNTEKTLKGFSERKRKEIFDILTKMYINISMAVGK